MFKSSLDDEEDYKSIKLPVFSDGSEWEAVVFELKINLEKVWKHSKEMDIVDYLEGIQQYCKIDYIKKADKIIYHAIVTAAKRDSFARKQIMAAEHDDAVPQIKRNEGLKLFNLFQSIFLNKSKDQANLPNAQKEFFTSKMKKGESAKDYISRVDKAVSDLAILNEKVTTNSWLFIMANGLLPEFKKCRDGVLFSEPDFDTIVKLKAKIMKEETVLGLSKPESKTATSSEMASSAVENCTFCNKKGHMKSECRKLKKEQAEKKAEKDKYWCNFCSASGHTTDYCYWNPDNNDQFNPVIKKGKGKQSKGKAKDGGGNGKGKGKKGKGNSKGGRGNGNFPASYTPNTAYYTADHQEWQQWDKKTDIKDESETPNWQDYNFLIFEKDQKEQLLVLLDENDSFPETPEVFLAKKDEQKSKKALNGNYSNSDWSNFDFLDSDKQIVGENFFVLLDKNKDELTAWTQNNAWTQQDFRVCTWGDQPTFRTTKGGPECDSLLATTSSTIHLTKYSIQQQMKLKMAEIKERKENGEEGLWMFLDSGASRSVIRENSPLRPYLYDLSETNGSCSVGNGASLQYLEKGLITNGNEVTVVKDLQFDLYAAVAAAKRGVSCILDFNSKGENRSYLLCKKSGSVTPLIERKSGILEVPVHLFVNKDGYDKGLTATETTETIPMSKISKFWYGMDRHEFDPECRANNKDELSLFMFDIIKSLNPKQRDYLIHARLAHLPRKAILQMVKNGAEGIPYEGKFKELCRPCLQAKQRAENHGKETNRHPEGKPGEHLHSDLAVVNLSDFAGYKYVLTVVDEISDEVIVTLLKTKDAETTLAACKKTLEIISARNNNIKLKTWQFDRGGEFLNDLFDEWIVRTIGAKQLFSNIEHPWENGRAERSFATIFAKARAMLMYADLPNGLWGKAVQHAVFLKNRCPSSRLQFMAPLQFRTGEKINFTRLRVFGCPAQIFVKVKDRENNKLSTRSEQGTFIGMSTLGNGFMFRIKRTRQIVEIDSADVKFNETFSDCRDKMGKIIKGGRVLDPDLINVPEATDPEMNNDKIEKESSRFSQSNYYSSLSDDEVNDDSTNDSETSSEDNASKKDENVKRFFLQPKIEPIKKVKKLKSGNKNSKTKATTEMNRLATSAGFTSKPPPINETRSRREPKPRDKFEPNFEPTYKRAKSILTIQSDEDDSNLDPEMVECEQLMSCMEQALIHENELKSSDEQEIYNSLLDLSSPDPKSQSAIDKMPEEKRKRYNDATIKEFEGMKKKKVMEYIRITDLPAGSKIYICVVNWVTKFVLGTYSKTKCRICFGGHHYVKTFTDCFAPTVNFCSVLTMLCLAAMFGWFIGSLDYSQAYLNADIDEECFLRAPDFLKEYDTDGTEFIWKLKKVIYGHPKGSRLWAECLTKKLQELGFKQLTTDQCVYAKWHNWNLSDLKSDSHFVFILVHSDDLIIISNLQSMMLQEKRTLLTAFEGVDQGNLSSFCGVEVEINDNGIKLSMEYYWQKIMKRFGISNDAKEDKPIKAKINKTDCPENIDEKRKTTYLQIIGSIIFGFTHCRLDLAFPVGMLTRVMHNPSDKHLKQLYGLLKYINATKSWALHYFRDYNIRYGMDFTFFAFCDSSHGDDESSFRSTGGWFFFLSEGQATISAKSGQTQDVALSSTEAETIWACSASTQGAFLKQFLDELNIFGKVSFDLKEDSMPAINAQRKNVSQSRFRHIKIKYHYLRQLINDGWCRLVKINTKEQVADIATKILSADTTQYFSKIILGID
jgi:hypothetical protein